MKTLIIHHAGRRFGVKTYIKNKDVAATDTIKYQNFDMEYLLPITEYPEASNNQGIWANNIKSLKPQIGFPSKNAR